ncbi:MFS transporter [Larsenimonas rhizosphaerae]|uniref:MFS transporter n=1 Tax=Larsenimonas rhizosphaerae TaxID=2944682 RepID=UPI002033CB07|nr:MFS transporter [Larsenimonas rhizosphaerae]MCM2131355.1 MHS family MFS transporter [Larsenimonas rhizosphaerae]
MTSVTSGPAQERVAPVNSPGKVIAASLIGTTIEFYDFYIYGIAAALVIGPAFFPASSEVAQSMGAFMSFGLAFLARPLGSVLFGHFGDRMGRKTTLVASLLLMGGATALIGLVPTYDTWGVWAPLALCVLRFCQGLGLGGEWGGAALLATENAPEGRRAWFGMFPQLGPSLGFLLANALFMGLLYALGEEAFLDWGWRIPFLVSAVLVFVGLYVRMSLEESPVFKASQQEAAPRRAPVVEVLAHHKRPLVQGTLAMVSCYALFYTSAVFALSHGTRALGYPKETFLALLCLAVVVMAVMTPVSAWWCDRVGRKPVLIIGMLVTIGSGMSLGPWLGSGSLVGVTAFLCLSLGAMGLIFAPMGALLPELFPTAVRYTGASAAYNLAGILGASMAPWIAELLVSWGGLAWVGGYVSVMALMSLVAILTLTETRRIAL